MKNIFVIIAYIFLGSHLYSQTFLELINKHRAPLGLSTLTVDSTLTRMARHHTGYLMATNEFSHIEKTQVDGLLLLEKPSSRFEYYSTEPSSTKYVSECISEFNCINVEVANPQAKHFDILLNSTPHKLIMEDPSIRKFGFYESFYEYEQIDSSIYNGRTIKTKNSYSFYTITVCFGK